MATLRWCFAVVEFDEAMISDCWAKHRRRKSKNELKHPPAQPDGAFFCSVVSCAIEKRILKRIEAPASLRRRLAGSLVVDS
jgi:hypothetical protein